MLQGVACGSGKLYLCFWVMKLVAVSMYKQKPTTSQFGGDCPLPLKYNARLTIEIIWQTHLKD